MRYGERMFTNNGEENATHLTDPNYTDVQRTELCNRFHLINLRMDKRSPLVGARRHVSWHSTDLTNGLSAFEEKKEAQTQSSRNIRTSVKVLEEDLGFSYAEV